MLQMLLRLACKLELLLYFGLVGIVLLLEDLTLLGLVLPVKEHLLVSGQLLIFCIILGHECQGGEDALIGPDLHLECIVLGTYRLDLTLLLVLDLVDAMLQDCVLLGGLGGGLGSLVQLGLLVLELLLGLLGGHLELSQVPVVLELDLLELGGLLVEFALPLHESDLVLG